MGDEFTTSELSEIAAAVGFTPSDLNANRQGQLTPRQIKQLRADLRRQYWPSLVAWSLIGALTISLMLMSGKITAGWLAAISLFVVLGMVSAYELRQRYGEMSDNRREVIHETLIITPAWTARRRLGVIEFSIGPRWFTVSRALLPLLHQGQRYHVYFARDVWSFSSIAAARLKTDGKSSPGSFRVLSIEPIGPHKA